MIDTKAVNIQLMKSGKVVFLCEACGDTELHQLKSEDYLKEFTHSNEVKQKMDAFIKLHNGCLIDKRN